MPGTPTGHSLGKQAWPLHPRSKVLVVGTTSDYIDWIRSQCPGRALFLTDPAVRHGAREPQPAPAEEILCDLLDYAGVSRALGRHLQREGLVLDGITSYDCESMDLAAFIAEEYRLPYPSREAVRNCRDKGRSKSLWQENRIPTPRSRPVRSPDDLAGFLRELGGPCVAKPPTGSGSELVFRCDREQDSQEIFQKIMEGLKKRRLHRLYGPHTPGTPPIMAEEWVEGDEFSCDFLIEHGQAKIIRMAGKILSADGPFGTTRGYVLPASPPRGMGLERIRETLLGAARALGLNRALCMVDFIVRQGDIFLLEMAPRPGGDCLPALLRHGLGLDIIGLALDFAQKRPIHLPPAADPRPCLGLRIHARKDGVLRKIGIGPLPRDERLLEVQVTREPGHVIHMPPEDYDSWIMGYIIARPFAHMALEAQCRDLAGQLVMDIGESG